MPARHHNSVDSLLSAQVAYKQPCVLKLVYLLLQPVNLAFVIFLFTFQIRHLLLELLEVVIHS